MKNWDKGVPIGFLRGDASDEEIREFVKKINESRGTLVRKPAVNKGGAGGKKLKRSTKKTPK